MAAGVEGGRVLVVVVEQVGEVHKYEMNIMRVIVDMAFPPRVASFNNNKRG